METQGYDYRLTDRQLSICERYGVPEEAVLVWLDCTGAHRDKVTDSLVEDICDNYMGDEWRSEREFAEYWADNKFHSYLSDPDLEMYFDYDSFARDIFIGDFLFVEGQGNESYVFSQF